MGHIRRGMPPVLNSFDEAALAAARRFISELFDPRGGYVMPSYPRKEEEGE